MDRPAIAVRGLAKQFGDVVALDALDLDVPAGSILGVLGPGGAGKSTLLHLLAGLAGPSGGSGEVAGVALGERRSAELQRRIGFLGQGRGLYDWMTGRELVAFAADLAGVRRREVAGEVARLVERLGVADVADEPIATLDRGTRRRIGLAQALVGEPEIVILDEPLAGLDPATRRSLGTVIGELKGHATVVVSSADPAHLEPVCDRVAVLEAGRLVLAARVDALLGGAATEFVVDIDRAPGLALAGLVARLGGEPWVAGVGIDGRALRVVARDVARAERELLPAVVATGLPIVAFRRERTTLAGAIAGWTAGARDAASVAGGGATDGPQS